MKPKPISQSKPPSSNSKKATSVPKEALMKTSETAYSFKSATTLGAGATPEEQGLGGESVKVALRIRPLNNMELNRGDQICAKGTTENACQVMTKYCIFYFQNIGFLLNYVYFLAKKFISYSGAIKQYQFNHVLRENCSQSEVFASCQIDV